MKYIDLGLPSGTLWAKKSKKGLFSYNRAIEKFGDRLPSKDQYDELIDNCTFSWDEEKKGAVFIGSNGNSIFFPAAGCRSINGVGDVGSVGYYWSATSGSEADAYIMGFDSAYLYALARSAQINRLSVHLIKSI